MPWKSDAKVKIISDYCDSYIRFPANDAMIDAYDTTPNIIQAWIADNEKTYWEIKKCVNE